MNRGICCIAFRAQKFSGILFRVPQLRSWTENDGWIQAIFYIISCRTDEESPLLLVGCKVFWEMLTYHTGERAFLTDNGSSLCQNSTRKLDRYSKFNLYDR